MATGKKKKASDAVQPRMAAQIAAGGPAFPENFHALYDLGFRSARGITAAAAPARATAAHRKLGRSVKGLDVHYDQATQLPNMIRVEQQPEARLSRATTAATPEEAALDFIKSQRELWNLSDADAASIEAVSVSQPRAAAAPRAATAAAAPAEDDFNIRNMQTVNLLQKIDGKEV